VNEVRPAPVVEEMRPHDWPAVLRIYEEGIRTGQATLETEVPGWEDWDRAHLSSPRVVAREGGDVVGWAALTPVSPRSVYRGVAEVSVYVTEGSRGRGIGRALLASLIAGSERTGIWTLQAVMFPENRASVSLHLSCDFRVVGLRERIGMLRGAWRDTVLLERRSPRLG
jgi:L-amino acid N-acyltransferase YncA